MDDTPYKTIIGDSRSWSAAEFLTLRRRAKLWIVPAVVALAAVIGSWGAVETIERAFQQNLVKKLEAIVASTTNSVALWSERQTLLARILAEDDRTERLVARLVHSPSTETHSLIQDELTERLETATAQFGFASFTIIDANGQTLATNSPLCGFNESQLSQFSQVFCGETVFADPSADRYPQDLIQPTPLWVAAPIQKRRTQETLATLICEVPSDEQFQRTLAASKFGTTGENFAVDRNGSLIGHALPGDRPDPGRVNSLVRRSALGVGTAMNPVVVDANGFHDTSGNRLVGGAKWLPEYGLGIVSTIDYDEAYASHNLFKRINAVVTSFALLGSCVGLLYTWYLSRAQLRAMQAESKLKNLGQYSLEEKIGEGGMGEVYRSTHRMLRRPTAVKLLPAAKSSPQTIERFEREVQLTSQLSHPNTISIYDFGRTSEGVFYYAMEYLDGVDLKKLVDCEGAQPEARVIHILLQICGSLNEAHSRGLVHRDIKPANVILCQRGGDYDVAKLLDFGLVYDAKSLNSSMEKTGISGTPAFMSPESIESPANVDQRSDIYSIGALAYFLLTGTYTFTGSSVTEIWDQQVTREPPPPSDRCSQEISPELDEQIMRCLAIDPRARPQSIEELLLALRDLQSGWSQEQAAKRSVALKSANALDNESVSAYEPEETLAYAS